MVLFLNLDSLKTPPHDDSHDDYQSIQAPHRHAPRSRALPTTKSQPNPNAAHPFTTLLSSYPLLISLAKHLDLGDLATLSRTCHPFRSLLLLQRENLTSTSLVCKNSGKQFCRCVKDLVNECRGCMEPVCRNCTRRPNPWELYSRLRRLCLNHRMCSLQEFGKVCDCAEVWLCAGCLGRYRPLEPTFVTAIKLVNNEKRECPLGKRGGYVGCSGDGDDCGTGSGCTREDFELEKRGSFREWCDWCNGVVLTAEERAALEKEG